MGDRIYKAEQAAADLAAADLLAGLVLPGDRDPACYLPGHPRPEALGGFAGAGLDSRALERGELFVAVKGEHVDGRAFAPGALENGHWVLAELPEDSGSGNLPGGKNLPEGTGIILSTDVPAALSVLAASWRKSLSVRVAGVTGTNGKTTTKDFLAALLRGGGPTCATAGNFNNRLGLPLTVLGLNPEHRFAVFEMGASAVGDIARLAPVAYPETAIITNAAPAHLAEFGTLEDIIEGKGEILDVLPPDGRAILNADSPGFDVWRDRAPCPVVSFGLAGADHVWTWDPTGSGGGPEMKLDGESWPVPLPGKHNGANLAAAILAARSLGLSENEIRRGLAGFAGSPHRGIVLELGGRIILDDCYNANPASMVAAGQALGKMAGSGRTLAVLGHMAELGDRSVEIHKKTGRDLAQGPVGILIAVGENARPMTVGFDAEGSVGHYCAGLEEAAELVARLTRAGDRLLIKGSRSAAMEDILPLLDAAFAEQNKTPEKN
jgi:UDP-N-acetylmuramoyl-tripeptide--D-alanyl-D-alanine ligase